MRRLREVPQESFRLIKRVLGNEDTASVREHTSQISDVHDSTINHCIRLRLGVIPSTETMRKQMVVVPEGGWKMDIKPKVVNLETR